MQRILRHEAHLFLAITAAENRERRNVSEFNKPASQMPDHAGKQIQAKVGHPDNLPLGVHSPGSPVQSQFRQQFV